jgi:hypothetical protein
MGALMSYVEMFAHPALTCSESDGRGREQNRNMQRPCQRGIMEGFVLRHAHLCDHFANRFASATRPPGHLSQCCSRAL